MSRIIYLASDTPLEEYKNPHDKLLSVNEAHAMGIRDIHEFLLADDFDRDRPGVLMVSDREVNINIDTGEITDGEYDDDFSVFPMDIWEEMTTEKKYCGIFEWPRYLPQRGEKFMEYILSHMKNSSETELRNEWLGSGGEYKTKERIIYSDELTGNIIKEFFSEDTDEYNICYTIKRRNDEQER